MLLRKRLALPFTALALLLAAFFGLRLVAWQVLQRTMLVSRPQGDKTPGTFGLAYEAVALESGGRRLQAFYVAPPPGAPQAALLIFHGNNESISSWTPVQKLLFDHGVGSMVFDYSGFGRSQGPLRVDQLPEDGLAAWSAFRARLPAGTRACAYGLSLGTGVLLEVAPRLQPAPDCLALWGAYTSALGAAVRSHRVPRWLAPLLPDALESVKNAARLPAPLLVEHGERDELFPPEDAQQIAAAAPGSRLLLLPGYTHAQPVVRPDETAWLPVIDFVRGGALRGPP
jgi:alpha-beta hydrolase superfamily lysophospholipase